MYDLGSSYQSITCNQVDIWKFFSSYRIVIWIRCLPKLATMSNVQLSNDYCRSCFTSMVSWGNTPTCEGSLVFQDRLQGPNPRMLESPQSRSWGLKEDMIVSKANWRSLIFPEQNEGTYSNRWWCRSRQRGLVCSVSDVALNVQMISMEVTY